MTSSLPTSSVVETLPAVLGGPPAWPEGLPLVRPAFAPGSVRAAGLDAVLASGQLTNGPRVRALEEQVADLLGVPEVVAVSSCTSGLMLTYQALGVRGPVVLPSFTFAASAHAVVWAGGKPRFADVDPETLRLDARAAAPLVAGAEALSATHLYGHPCDTDLLQRLADAAGVPLVYDAAHALGSMRQGRPVGGAGTAEVFSLSPTKVVVAGEGGLVSTRDRALAAQLRLARDYGNPGDYNCVVPGLNARMSELHAATALASLDGLAERVAWRNELAGCFQRELEGCPGVGFPAVDSGDVSTYKDLTLLTDPEVAGLTGAQLQAALRAEGIDSRRYYAPPVHRQRAYADLPCADLPVTDAAAEQVLTLPLWSQMTQSDVLRTARAVRRVLEHAPAVRTALAAVPAQLVRP